MEKKKVIKIKNFTRTKFGVNSVDNKKLNNVKIKK